LLGAAVAVVAALLIAIAPAWHLADAFVYGRVRVSGPTTTESRRALRARGVLLTTQVALSVTLLVVTGLLTTSFLRLLRSDPGFEARSVLALDLVLPVRYTAAERATVADRVLEGVRRVPGVTAAAWTHRLPLIGQGTVNPIAAEGDPRPLTQQPSANYRYVSSQFFSALKIPLSRGRTFAEEDRDRPTVPAVVSQRAASLVWPHQDPIGRRFRWSRDLSEKPVEVIGVVPETRTDLDHTPPPMVYMPYWYRPRSTTSLVLRTAVDPASLAREVRRAIRAEDPEIAIAEARPLQQVVDSALAGRRYQVRLFVAFGLSALLIATLGVYAVTAYGVSRRRREMNIRAALGATAGEVLRLVVRQGLPPLAFGIALGVLGAVLAGGAVASQLIEVSGRDPRVVSAVAFLVAAVCLFATVAAARQELRLDPASALREE
ncbi:MAG TPA: ABC transporter permease, partial [Vicinamibacteria bacterium]|nr:ABC transporter permease [Vicinamibacteria bacterium]